MTEPSRYRYLILGAGRQGTAAAYDLARFGNAERIVLADMNERTAQRAAERVNLLSGNQLVEPLTLDVTKTEALRDALQGMNVVLSAVPYTFNLAISRAAIECGVHMCDMGGNTGVVWQQLELDEAARQAGVSLVPDCGMGPGLTNTLGAYAVELLDEPREVYIYDAGLPQKPVPPWNYQLTFHINGLTNEMYGQAAFLRDGRVVYVDTLTEPERIDFPGLGVLEADVTSGGTSTSPWTFEGKLERYENKVLRYPGHFEWLRAYKKLGLFSEEPVQVGNEAIVPRQLYHALLEPKISAPQIRDVCVMRAKGVGKKDGRDATVIIDLIDYFDDETMFTSMERLTGWHCAIMMFFQASGRVQPGGVPMETAVPASEFMEEIRKRGIKFTVRWE